MKALITGITGQDGWYLSELLLEKGYEVIGLRRRNAQAAEVPPWVEIVNGDLTDAVGLTQLIYRLEPQEIYNLAAFTHVAESFEVPQVALEVNGTGTLNVLRAANDVGAKVLQASTSELFGDSPPPQDETTPMRPRSPYAIGKLAAYWLTRNYRERGLFAVNSICFNHESPRRGADFVTQKVCTAAAKRGQVTLGNIDAMRDWGHAKDYVRGMWLMMQQKEPDDYVLATGEMRSVRELCWWAYAAVGIDNWRQYVDIDRSLFRPTEVEKLCGNPAKAEAIGWKREYTFQQMIEEMVSAAARH